ncbi:MAG TPA: 2-amino-4-hydroxy-6-hydroxymethyldihydropteridine diphosphokinase [Desulfuromonadales bacterium]|nr:2-amino-4-hydroxy-6-hydroxymethyldihydropteridine diphosphokinase [Desulfuromonadales bacterium]
MNVDAYIGLGSNLGDREFNLLMAVAEIGKVPESKVTALSPFYETTPVGSVKQDNFYNAVLKLETGLAPRKLLEHLLQIESSRFKRKRTVLQGPRRMDLDLLLYGSEIIEEDGLTVPHPRLSERRFVLQPLCSIAPQLLHPASGRSIAGLLAALVSDETVTAL